MKTLNKQLNPLVEIMSFEGNKGPEFKVKIYKKRNMYSIVITDLLLGTRKRKVHQCSNLDECMLQFNKIVKIYTDRVK